MSEKLYKIGQAAALLNLNTSVLRFWETVFPQLAPRRTDSGQRFYTEEDMALLRRIQQLLHQKGMTIEGARRILDGSATLDEVLPERAASKRDPALMLKLKNELTELRRRNDHVVECIDNDETAHNGTHHMPEPCAGHGAPLRPRRG